MTVSEAQARDRRFAMIAVGIAALVILAASILTMVSTTSPIVRYSGDKVFADVEQTPDTIRISTRRDTYTLEKTETGWILTEHGRFPVNDQKMQHMLEVIANARFTDARTLRPELHDDLGLGNPFEEGSGALITLPGQEITGALIGVKGGQTFGRKAGDNQTWRVSQSFPALHEPSWWLDPNDIGIPRTEEIQSVEIRTPSDELSLKIAADSADFTDADAILLEASTALHLLDVRSTDDVETSPFATHLVLYRSGKSLRLDLYEVGTGIWAEISGDALAEPDLAEERLFHIDPLIASDLLPY